MSRKTESQRMQHRITILGEGGTGKTAISVQFTRSEFVETYDPTIEDSYRRQWVVDGRTCMMLLLDTAGQEEYVALRNQWIQDGEGFLLVYSISSRSSFLSIQDIHDRVRMIKTMQNDPNPPIVLVGNKSDRFDRQVSYEEGEEMMSRCEGVDAFFEVSARNNLGIEESFRHLTRLMNDHKDGRTRPPGGGGGDGAGSSRPGSTGSHPGGVAGMTGASGAGAADPRKKRKKKSGCTLL